ncbi:MAG: ribosome maturation factor RimP [Candidatus Izimaplasma sp.]|nr:ribosome maturation factor RimP [Candidatus Izimaplasma bacterium]
MEKLKKRFKEIIENLGYYLYDIIYEKENGGYVLKVLIENDTFIDVDDCVKVSKVLSDELDILDPFTDAYNLEVSSSGAERELRNSEEIKRAVGKTIHLKTIEQSLEGKLISFKDGVLELKYKNKITKIDYIDVSYIRLTIIF